MVPRTATVLLAAAAFALLPPALGQGVPQDAYEREVWARAVALDQVGEEDLFESLSSPDWTLRRASADGLARREVPLSATLLDLLVGLLEDPRAAVREHAARALLRAGDVRVEGPIGPEPGPGVRHAIAQEGTLAQAAALAQDPDPWVADAARWRVFEWGEEAVHEQARLLKQGVPAESVLEPLALGGVAASLPPLVEGSVDEAVLLGWRVRAGLPFDALRLAWCFERGADSMRIHSEREEVARAAGTPLGRALLVRLQADRERSLHPTVRQFLLECVAAALPLEEVCGVLPDLELEDASLLLDAALQRWRRPDPELLGPFLRPEAPADLRGQVLPPIAGALGGPHDEAAVRLLLPLITDRNTGLRMEAFRWLGDQQLESAEEEAFFGAWQQLGEQERALRLRRLSREHPWPAFREELLRRAGDEATHTTSVAELLAAFEGDRDVAVALEIAVERGLADLARQTERGKCFEAEGRVAERLQALESVAADVAREWAHTALSQILGSRAPSRHELLKAAVSILGRTDAGRRRLAPHLSPDRPTRARFEVALALSPVPEAVAVLLDRFAEVDRVLQLRGVRALERAPTESVHSFLRALLTGNGPFEVRIAALEALAAQGDLASLAAQLTGEDYELRLAALDALAELEGGEELLEQALVERLTVRPFSRMDEDEGTALLDLLRARATHGPIPSGLLPLVLARPAAASRSDLTARFQGQGLPGIASRWRPELEAFACLVRTGQASAALAAQGAWWRLDARLLFEMAWLARSDNELAGRLLTAARVGLQGEAEPDETLVATWWRAGQGAADPEVHARRSAASAALLGRIQRARLPR